MPSISPKSTFSEGRFSRRSNEQGKGRKGERRLSIHRISNALNHMLLLAFIQLANQLFHCSRLNSLVRTQFVIHTATKLC